MEASRGGAQPSVSVDGITGLLDSLFSGRRITKRKLDAAWQDVSSIMGGRMPPMPDMPPMPTMPGIPPMGQARAQSRQQPRQPPRVDPAVVEAKRRFMAAKRTMGFPDSQQITADDVRERRKELAKKLHPDRPGGSVEKMAAVNAAADELLAAA